MKIKDIFLNVQTGVPIRDLNPPDADRNEWRNVSNARMIGDDLNKVEMYVNAVELLRITGSLQNINGMKQSLRGTVIKIGQGLKMEDISPSK